MARGKRHLVIKTSGRTACGLMRPPLLTVALGQVTCGGCQRSLHMADAEAKQHIV